MLSSVTTHSSFTKSVAMSVAVSKVGVVSCRAWNKKSIDSYWLDILLILYQQTLAVIKHVVDDNIIAFQQQIAWCAQQFNSCCCCTKLSTSFLLSYWLQQARAELNWLQDLGSLQHCEYELQVNNWRNEAATGWTIEKQYIGLIQHLCKKMWFSCFCVLPAGSAEALLRWSG